MKRRVIRILIWAALGPLIIVLAAGLLSSRDYAGSKTVLLDASIEKVWNLLNDVEGLPKRNKSVRSIDLLEKKDGHAQKWREHMDMGEEALIEVSLWKEKSLVQWTMLESGFGMTGTWTFELKPLGSKTSVELSEKSRCDKFMTRAALTLSGRDINIKRMLGDFEEALK